MSPARSILLVAAGLFAWLGAEPVHAGTITVACASSLQDVIRAAAGVYEQKAPTHTILVSAGASSLLARQIDRGAPIDLFLSADEQTIAWLTARGRIDSTAIVRIAGNRIVVVAPTDRVLEISGPADLAGPEIRRIASCAQIVPIGRYAEAFLEAAGLRGKLRGRIVRTENARASLAAAVAGAVDLAFVYATDAATSEAVGIVWEVDPGLTPAVRAYGAPVVGAAGHEAAARFLAYLRSDAADRFFLEAGFTRGSDVER